MGSDPLYAKYPNLTLAHHIFVLKSPFLSASHPLSQQHLTQSITTDRQAPLYRYLYHPTDGTLAGKQSWDEQLYNGLIKKNTEEREGYEKEMKEAEEKAGETEVTEWMGKIAEFWARVCDKVRTALWMMEGYGGVWREWSNTCILWHRINHWHRLRHCTRRHRHWVQRLILCWR